MARPQVGTDLQVCAIETGQGSHALVARPLSPVSRPRSISPRSPAFHPDKVIPTPLPAQPLFADFLKQVDEIGQGLDGRGAWLNFRASAAPSGAAGSKMALYRHLA
jgi:hypothetical protein